MVRRTLALVLVGLAALDAAGQPKKPVDRHGDPLPDGALMRLGTVRGRANITSFGILADGTVVSIGDDRAVRTWDKDEDTSLFPIPIVLPGPQMYGTPQVSPDGSKVAVHTAKKVFVFERPDGALKKLAEFDVEGVRRMIFSPDGTKLFVAWEEDRHTRYSLGDVATGRLRDFDESNQSPECVAFSGDGKRVAMLSYDHFVAWSTETGRPVADFKIGKGRIGHFALDHTGDTVAVTVIWEPYDVRYFSGLTGKPIDTLKGPAHYGWVAFAPDNKTVLVGNPYGVSWWDPAANKLVRRFEGSTNQRGIFGSPGRFTPDSKTLVSNTEKALLRWDAATGKPRFPTQDAGHQHSVYTLALSPDGKTFVTGGRDGRVRTWDAGTGEPRHTFPSSVFAEILFTADSRYMYSRRPSWGGPLKWDVATGKEVGRFEYDPAQPEQGDPRSLVLSADGKTLTARSEANTSGKDGLLTVWDTGTGKRLSTTVEKEERGGMQRMFGSSKSPDGRWESVMSMVYPVGGKVDDSVVPAEVWKRARGMVPGRFTPDSRLVAVSGEDIEKLDRPWHAVVCELATGGIVLDAPGGWVEFSPDGRTLAVAEATDIVLWDVPAGKELVRYANAGKGGNGGRSANSMKFVAGGTKLMTGHADTTALVWPVPARPKAKPLDAAGLAAAWDALGGADAAKGWAAIATLADDAGAAAFLKAKLKPVPLPAGKRPAGDALRALRAVAALELGGTADARAVLAGHAKGAADTTAAEAKRALERIAK